MIFTELNGGLGNQLFQYAAGRALAHRHRTELFLGIASLNAVTRRVTKRHFELDRFSHIGRIARANMSLPSIFKRLPMLSRLISPWQMHTEIGPNFDPHFIDLPNQTYLVGYWQSYRYFAEISKTLFSELTPTQPLSEQSTLVASRLSESNVTSVGLHVRRGDYVSSASASKYHGLLPLSYYEAALKLVHKYLNNPSIYVFSDDVPWCRENLPIKDSEAIFVSHNVGSDAWQDLILMSHCRHNVIANSSFSWWGAWMADQRWLGSNRLVIAPSRWFVAHDKHNLTDRFPINWEVL